MKRIAILALFGLSALAIGQTAPAHASATLTQVITAAPAPLLNASVTVASSLNPSPVGNGLTITANVTGSGVQPTGQVSFSYNGVAVLETVLVNGVATCTVPGNEITTPGSFPIVATYIPDTASTKIYN